MIEHPEDTPMNRFLAFWWALGAILFFGVLALVFAGVNTVTEDDRDEFENARVAARVANLKAVAEAQEKLISGTGEVIDADQGKIRIPVDVALELMLPELQGISPKASKLPVPGTPAALELMKKQAEEQAAKAAAEKAADPAQPEKQQ